MPLDMRIDLKENAPQILETDPGYALKAMAPSVWQGIEKWLARALASKREREARMEQMRLFIISAREEREGRLRDLSEAIEQSVALQTARVDNPGFRLENTTQILKALAKPDGRLLKPSERARAFEAESVAPLIRVRG